MFTLYSMLSIIVMISFYVPILIMMNTWVKERNIPVHEVDIDFERNNMLYGMAMAGACRRINTKYNRVCVADKYRDLALAWSHYHNFIQLMSCKGIRYTPSGLKGYMGDELNKYCKELINQHTRSQRTMAIINGLHRIHNEHWRFTYDVIRMNDLQCQLVAITIADLQTAMADDLLKIDNKDILSPYYQFDIGEDNYVLPIYPNLKKYVLEH